MFKSDTKKPNSTLCGVDPSNYMKDLMKRIYNDKNI